MISFQASTSTHSRALLAGMTPKQTYWAAALSLPLVVGPLWWGAGLWSVNWLGTLSGFVLLASLATAAVTDVKRHKIYNWTSYSAILWALLINLWAMIMSSGEGALNHAYHRANALSPEFLGSVGLGQSLAGAGLCFLITLAGYHLSGRGAGDVKIATAIGALLGIHHGLFAVAYSYIVAAVAIVVWSIWINGPLTLIKAAARSFGAWLGPLWPFPPTSADTALMVRPIPLGPYFAIGTLLVVLEIVPL
jgi:Flp pilus assembly protein protease CpaA